MGVPVCQDEVVTNPGGTGTTITPTISSHTEDDLLIIQVGWKGSQAPTALTGWTHWFTNVTGSSSTGVGQGVWWRRVNPAETVTSPTLTLGSTAVERVAICYTIRGADIDNPANTFYQRQQTVGNSATPTPPTITTAAPNYLLLHMVSCRGNSAITQPTDYTEQQDAAVGTTVAVEGSTKTQATAAAVSGQAASITSARWVAAIIGIPSPDYAYFRSGTQTSSGATTFLTGTLPTGTTAADFFGNKDLVIATVQAAGVAPTANTPGDWTEISSWSITTSGGATTVRKWWALYDGSLDLRFNRSGSGEIGICLTTYRNTDQTSPIGNSDADGRASSTTSTWDAVNRSETNATVTATCVADGTPTFTSPAGWTERMDGGGIGCSDQIFEASGSTASASFTLSVASPTAVGLVEIKSISGTGDSNLPLTLSDDAANLADALSKVGGQLKTFTDTVTLTDALTAAMEHRFTFADDVNLLADAESHEPGIAAELADALAALADAQAQLLVYLLALADTTAANWADEHQLLLAHFLALSDLLALSDATDLRLEERVDFTDTLDPLSDAVVQQLGTTLTLTDTLATLTDAYIQQAVGLLTFTDTLDPLTDELALGYGLIISDDAFNLVDAYAQQLNDVTNAIELGLSDALATPTDAYTHQLGQLLTFADSVDNLSDAYTQLAVGLLNFSDTLVLTDSLAATFHYSLFLDDDINTFVDLLVTDSPQAPEIQVGVVDTLAPLGDSLTLILGHHLTAADNAALLADSVAKTLGLASVLVDNLPSATDSIVLFSAWLLQFADSIALTDAFATFGENFLTVADSFTLSDDVDVELRGPDFNLALSDALTFNDAIVLSLGVELQLQLTLTDALTLTDHYFDLRYPYSSSAKRYIVVPSRARTTVVPPRSGPTRVP